jgi:hypothetical protein
MKTIDLKKTLKPYYTASAAKLSFIDVPPMNGLMVDGMSDPNGQAVETVKKKAKFARFPEVRFEKFHEGLAAQIMHVGPYSAEGPTIKRLRRFVEEQGYQLRGKHHEIYLGDPRRSAPEKLRTIIRHPVEKAKP